MIRAFLTVAHARPAVAVGLLFMVVLAGCQTPTTRPPLRVGISLDIPPYVMGGGTSGIEADLIRAALPGTPIEFVQMPYDALQTAVPDGRVDVALAVQRFSDDGAHYSNDFVTFSNAAITKKSAGLTIDSIADLAGHKVLTWQEANLELGLEFKALFGPGAPRHQDCTEFPNQADQVRAFWAAKTDVIVIDRSIFDYFTTKQGYQADEVVYHNVFAGATHFRAAFKDAGLRDAFDQGILELCRSGRYAEVLKKYHVELPRTVCDP